MKTQKMITTFFAVLITAGASGQEQYRQHMRIHQFDSSLQLTAEQKQEMKAIHESYQVKQLELQAQKRQLRKEEMQEVRKVLTPEQRKQFRDMRSEQTRERNRRHDEVGTYRKEKIEPVLKSYRLKLELELSEDEKTNIQKAREIQAELREGRKAALKEHSEVDGKQRLAMKDKRNEMINLLRPVIQSHAEFLENMRTELSDEREQWETDLREKQGAQKRDRGRTPHSDAGRGAKVAHFLLMEV